MSKAPKRPASGAKGTKAPTAMAPKARRTVRSKTRPEDVDTKWLLDRLADKGLSARKASAMMGMSDSLLSRRIHGQIGWGVTEAEDFATIVGQPAEEVARRVGLAPRQVAHKAKVSGIADAKGRIKDTPPRQIPTPGGGEIASLEGVAVEAPGAPLDRSVCFYAPVPDVDPRAVGRLAVMGVDDKRPGRMLGILEQGFDRRTWNVRGMLGELVAEGVQVKWASPVAWARL